MDRVLRIKFKRSCFRLTLPFLKSLILHAFRLSSSGALCIVVWGRHVGGVIS